MITLRPYQASGVQEIRDAFSGGYKAPLFVLPTGGGKTVMFSYIAESSERRGKRVLIMAHRVELVDQIVTSLNDFGVKPDIIAAGYRRRTMHTNHSVAVASVQTLVRRISDYHEPTLIVCDEAHHVAGANSWAQILRAYPNARVLGVTATPIRLDGRGLAANFDKMIVGPTVRELMDQGYLTPARVFAPPTVDTSGLHIRAGEVNQEEAEALMDVPSITGDALEHYRKHADGLPALAFCTSVAHAHHVAEQFRKENITAVALDGTTDPLVRRNAVQDFRARKIRVLTSCDLFSEGFDCPGVHAGIMLRPTASESLWRQQIGRVLRIAPGKTHALIFDHVNGTMKFDLPDADREWELTVDEATRKKKAAPSVRVCPKCFAASPARSPVCVEPGCGHIFEVKPRAEPEQREGELVELTAEQVAAKRERMNQGRAGSLEQLREFGRRKGYADGWADHVWEAREKAKAKKLARKMEIA